jgi:hypothetical protein
MVVMLYLWIGSDTSDIIIIFNVLLLYILPPWRWPRVWPKHVGSYCVNNWNIRVCILLVLLLLYNLCLFCNPNAYFTAISRINRHWAVCCSLVQLRVRPYSVSPTLRSISYNWNLCCSGFFFSQRTFLCYLRFVRAYHSDLQGQDVQGDSFLLGQLDFEDATDTLSRNVGKNQPTLNNKPEERRSRGPF